MLNQIKKDLARINKNKYDSIINVLNAINPIALTTETICECCPHCGNEIEMNHNVAESGFAVICPECGEKMMICSECTYIFGDYHCDWNSAENSCFADKISSSICIHHHREAQLRKDVESMLRNAVSDDYTSRILDIILEDCVNDVKTSSAYEEDGYYNMDDIRLAIGRTLLSKLEE